MPTLSHIRNFCIIAHIDHGKSTLADRILQLTHSVTEREFRDQVLDAMDLERERGISIKSHPVTMRYAAVDGQVYEFNLIDTPGHVDFNYEVSRSMAACEGAILVVDASQGVEAQTVANAYLAVDRGLEIIPVINKVDLPNANLAETIRQIEEVLAIKVKEPLAISAKTGEGVPAVLEAIVRRLPPPQPAGAAGSPTRALVFDSAYDDFRGVVTYVRVMDGGLKAGQRIRFMHNDMETQIKEVGVFTPKPRPVAALATGQVGYLIGTLRKPSDVRVGDTVAIAGDRAVEPLAGFKPARPMVFSGLYPVDTGEYEKFQQSLEKLSLNDSALTFTTESSAALGFGFRCGFLGLLHMEIVQERLRREFDLHIISTHPSVIYRVHLRNGSVQDIDNPLRLPDPTMIERIEEPMVRAYIICLNEQIGDVMRLVKDRLGELTRTESVDPRRVMLTCSLPLNEIITAFHDVLKSVSRGYASMDYDLAGYQENDIVRMDILLNGEPVDAFASLVHRSKAAGRGRQICEALKEHIPQHQFAVPIQAAVGRTIIARETLRAYRKDVTAKLYGGDVTRKRKVLERQKEGKRRLKQFGQVHVPQKAFVAVLKVD